MISFKGDKANTLCHENHVQRAFTMYISGKPVSFLGVEQNESKLVVNLRGKPRFSGWCN